MSEREIRRKIRELKELKKNLRPKTEERRNINKGIRQLNKELNQFHNIAPEKVELIKQINKIYYHYNDLKKFTIEQLQYHLDKIKEKPYL